MYPYNVVDLLPAPRMRSYQSGAEVPKLGFLFFLLFFSVIWNWLSHGVLLTQLTRSGCAILFSTNSLCCYNLKQIRRRYSSN